MNTILRSAIVMTLASCFYACGGAPAPAAETPPASPPPSAKPEAKVEPKPEEAKAEAASADTTPTERDPRADGPRKASRPPAELITNPSVLFVFNFGDSAVGQSAKEQCAESSGGAPDQLAACLQKARGKVPVESIRFVKKGSEYWWTTFNRYKGNLLKWHVVQFQVGDEGADRVTLKLMGKDKGIAPLARVPRTLEIELPNDYSIVLNDAEYGKMSFDAKFGKLPED